MYYTLTCTAHIFTYTAHICLLYKGTHVYSLIIKYNTIIQWYQSHYSDIFLAVLSLLVLLHSQHRFRHHNSRRSLSSLNLWRLPAVVFGFRTCSRCCWGVLDRTDHCTCHHRCKYYSDHIFGGITKIVLRWSTYWWKPRSHRRPHVPSCATQSFCVKAHVPHAPSSAPADVIRDVINATSALAYISIQSSADIIFTSSCWCHPLTVDRWIWLCVDFDRWLFSRIDFCSPSSPHLVFRVDFIFVVCFCILCL